MPLTKQEKETIVVFNEDEPIAHIFTYSEIWQKHIEGKLGLKAVEKNSFGGREYLVPKKRISLPKAPRTMSKSALDALQKARNSRKSVAGTRKMKGKK